MPTVLITGANRGIGLEYTKQYAAEDWRVIATMRDPEHGIKELERAARERRTNVQIERLDVTDLAQVSGLAKKLEDTPIDVLINNAGILQKNGKEETGRAQSFGHIDYGHWMKELKVNTLGPFAMVEAFVDHLARSDKKTIVNMSSGLGSLGKTDQGGYYYYRTSKCALNMLTRALAAELAGRGIKVVSLDPGWVETRMGGENAKITPAESVEGLRKVIAKLKKSDSGKFFNYRGEEQPF